MQNDGGPAFPRSMGHNGMLHREEHESNSDEMGMSLRDYFAGQALITLPLSEFDVRRLQASLSPDYQVIARICYNLADAMLKEREK
jgi:hypothetical protein